MIMWLKPRRKYCYLISQFKLSAIDALEIGDLNTLKNRSDQLEDIRLNQEQLKSSANW